MNRRHHNRATWNFAAIIAVAVTAPIMGAISVFIVWDYQAFWPQGWHWALRTVFVLWSIFVFIMAEVGYREERDEK